MPKNPMERLKEIYDLFGQIPDVLKGIWIQVALGEIEEAKQTINALPHQHPFEIKYHQKVKKSELGVLCHGFG